MDYAAETALVLNTANKDSYENRPAQFFHLTPFGVAEQHPYLNGKGKVHLFPQFELAEFYVGVSGLVPPQNLSLLFQVVDGTANPLAEKPKPHIDWAYLKRNEWIEFDQTEVQDGTDEMLNSESSPCPCHAMRRATNGATGWILDPRGCHDTSDAVCRLQLVAAQAMKRPLPTTVIR